MIKKEHLIKLFENNPYLYYNAEYDCLDLKMTNGREITEVNTETTNINTDEDIAKELEEWCDVELKRFFSEICELSANNSDYYEKEEEKTYVNKRMASLEGKAKTINMYAEEQEQMIRNMLTGIDKLKEDILKYSHCKESCDNDKGGR